MAYNQESQITILSKQLVLPSPKTTNQEDVHLTSWDLTFLSMDYMQLGLLYPKPQNQSLHLIISNLKTSFSSALRHFYPFAGRFSTTNHPDGTLSIRIACADEGAEFVHATANHVAISDVLSGFHVPDFVHSAFPLRGVIGHDGHVLPLLAVQVTELADGVFMALSINHAVSDGTSLWKFVNLWSEISRNLSAGGLATNIIHSPPVLDRWFLDSCPPPIRMPFGDSSEFVKRVAVEPSSRLHCFFHFSARTVKNLKAKANAEMGHKHNEISSLQALAAHAWRTITRARKLGPETPTVHVMAVGFRSRLLKARPVPQGYVGNAISALVAITSTRELLGNGLGWAASLVNKQIAAQTEEEVYKQVEDWSKNPSFSYLDNDNGIIVYTVGSPRFDIYGNDFGWGRPVAMRTGGRNRAEGRIGVYPGPEPGSIELDVYLAVDTMSALLQDGEFMETILSWSHL